jgi:hypothetical protein
MTQTYEQRPVYTTTEFDRWWTTQGQNVADTNGVEPSTARALTWLAWRAGREQLNESTAYQRLQPIRR